MRQSALFLDPWYNSLFSCHLKSEIKGKKIDTGRRKLGAIMGDDVQTGINVNLMPGVKVGSGAWIAPGLSVYEDVKSGAFLRE